MVKLHFCIVCLGSIAVLAAPRLDQSEIHLSTAVADSAVLGVFEGRTPCGPVAVEFTGFPATNCEKIKWELTLFVERESRRPSGFRYRGTRTSRRGDWSIVHGTASDRDAVVYRLSDAGYTVLSLLRADENVLLILNPDLTVAVGDASWSYALNRTEGGE